MKEMDTKEYIEQKKREFEDKFTFEYDSSYKRLARKVLKDYSPEQIWQFIEQSLTEFFNQCHQEGRESMRKDAVAEVESVRLKWEKHAGNTDSRDSVNMVYQTIVYIKQQLTELK